MAKIKSASLTKYGRVLLIDDDQIDNFINERMITSTNFAREVIVKNAASDALAYLKTLLEEEDALPEIIFLDLNMPIMDGFQFLEEYSKLVEKHEKLRAHSKIMVLSSSISEADIDKASSNPFVFRYLNKPLSEKYLQAINL